MPKTKRAPVPGHDIPTEPFPSTQEAWFWFARCQMARRDGARFERRAGAAARPCDPDDIFRIVARLRRSGALTPQHVAVLVRFGATGRPPDGRLDEERQAWRIWDAALDRLSSPLRAKGIVDDDHDVNG